MLAIQNFAEATHGFFNGYVFAVNIGELLRHEKRLGEETLDLAGTRNQEFIIFAEFVNTQNGNDILQQQYTEDDFASVLVM